MALDDGVFVRLEGLDELKRELQAIPAKLRYRALRNALAAGARIIRDDARRRTPLLKASTFSGAKALRLGYRKVGTVRSAITVRTSKRARKQGNVGVFVNVRPAKGSARGARKPTDPFYWRWLEFGWTPRGGQPKAGAGMLQSAAQRLPAALREFQSKLAPMIRKLNQPKAPPP